MAAIAPMGRSYSFFSCSSSDRAQAALLQFFLVLLEALFQRFEFLAGTSQHRFLNLELLPSYEVQFAKPGGKY